MRPLYRRLAAAALLAAAGSCSRNKAAAPVVQTATVERQDIVVDVEATGVIQPTNTVEVKSKASGQISAMPVTIGSQVKRGDLLVQIDPRDVQNRYNQALAAMRAAEANLKVAQAQKERNDELFAQRVITATEHETSTLNFANAQSQLAAARANLDIAAQQLQDATIRAPVAATVIEKDVSLGQVISGASSSASGGTTLLKMADLSQILDSALVNESDIGNVRPGQTATISVDAYPNRTFTGVVLKVAPQAVVQQSVTLFPVLISLDNAEGLLMPGMNSDVSILVQRRTNVVAVPNDAVRSPRDATTAALALNLDPNTVRSQLASQGGGRFAAGRRGGGGGGGGSLGAASVAGDVAGTELAAGGGGPGRGVTPSQQQCDSVNAALARPGCERAPR